MPDNSDSPNTGHLSRNPDQIEQWAKEHEMVPVRTSEGATEERFRMLREDEVEAGDDRMSWEEFESELEGGEEVVIHRGAEAERPLEVSGRRQVLQDVDEADLEERLLEGETVETQITETRVVESVVVEELDVESHLVDSEVVSDDVVDVELVDQECTNCTVSLRDGDDAREWFDTDRYREAVTDDVRYAGPTDEPRAVEARTGSIDTAGAPFRAELETEETWLVTRDILERHTVESEITGQEVTEADTVADYDVDVDELHRTIVDQGLLAEYENRGATDQDVMTHYDVESEVAGDDTIRSTFERRRTVEDELSERKRFDADLAGGEYLQTELLSSREPELTGADEADVATAPGADETAVAPNETATTGEEPAVEGSAVDLDAGVVGNTVVDADGDQIGMVSDVDAGADDIFVDVHPSITEKIKTRLGWGGRDEEDYRLGLEDVAAITDDEVRLVEHEAIDETGGETR